MSCKTLSPIRIEEPKKFDFSKAKNDTELVQVYEKAYAELIRVYLRLLEDVWAADGKQVKIIDLRDKE